MTGLSCGRKSFAISIPACTSPPGLSRRSSTKRSTPSPVRRSTAAATSRSARALNSRRRMYPTSGPTLRAVTGDLGTVPARSSCVSSTLPSAARRTATPTREPGAPEMSEETSNGESPETLSPFTRTTSSPCLIPALYDELSSTRPSTLSPLGSSGASTMLSPTPLMSYFFSASNPLGVTKRVYGSRSVASIDLMAAYASFRERGGSLSTRSFCRSHSSRRNPSLRAPRKCSSITLHASSTTPTSEIAPTVPANAAVAFASPPSALSRTAAAPPAASSAAAAGITALGTGPLQIAKAKVPAAANATA
mmetsp:Transcript_7724/g.25620  ORF Transcript_7724/g.25620 Transcript_7724/m.25620 type:complete len:307 (-) Transcript_7724:232-1152(-)